MPALPFQPANRTPAVDWSFATLGPGAVGARHFMSWIGPGQARSFCARPGLSTVRASLPRFTPPP